mmetsp:Transcript_30798/g.66634  ORF Transcript_30798/g.66634 Transcript_30798/m.66634 type:complete len:81 (-) Transcript_30798:117-359(-)
MTWVCVKTPVSSSARQCGSCIFAISRFLSTDQEAADTTVDFGLQLSPAGATTHGHLVTTALHSTTRLWRHVQRCRTQSLT